MAHIGILSLGGGVMVVFCWRVYLEGVCSAVRRTRRRQHGLLDTRTKSQERRELGWCFRGRLWKELNTFVGELCKRRESERERKREKRERVCVSMRLWRVTNG